MFINGGLGGKRWQVHLILKNKQFVPFSLENLLKGISSLWIFGYILQCQQYLWGPLNALPRSWGGHIFKDFKIVFTSTIIFFSYVHLDIFLFLHPLACLERASWLACISGKPPLCVCVYIHTKVLGYQFTWLNMSHAVSVFPESAFLSFLI